MMAQWCGFFADTKPKDDIINQSIHRPTENERTNLELWPDKTRSHKLAGPLSARYRCGPRLPRWHRPETRARPIGVARKPLIGTVAANVLKHGTGAINLCVSGAFSMTMMRPKEKAGRATSKPTINATRRTTHAGTMTPRPLARKRYSRRQR